MTASDSATLSTLLGEVRDFRAEMHREVAGVKADLSALSDKVRSLEDSRLSDTATARTAAAAAATAASTAAAAAVAVASAASAAATAKAEHGLSLRAWIALGFTAVASSVVAFIQLADYLGKP